MAKMKTEAIVAKTARGKGVGEKKREEENENVKERNSSIFPTLPILLVRQRLKAAGEHSTLAPHLNLLEGRSLRARCRRPGETEPPHHRFLSGGLDDSLTRPHFTASRDWTGLLETGATHRYFRCALVATEQVSALLLRKSYSFSRESKEARD